MKDRMAELNTTINWKPESTGTGRFGNWLENLVDWNLSRSRYWGIPLPIWRSEDAQEELCIGSLEQLREDMKKSIAAGFMDAKHLEHIDPAQPDFDLHRPYVDNIVLVSPTERRCSAKRTSSTSGSIQARCPTPSSMDGRSRYRSFTKGHPSLPGRLHRRRR
ncbi:class I tRNA ligase family protein [Candidatus Pollutiaquabacter sp.]|uniref:class I tRNA ligase family protein n=1 Tax=Candidatus Pollutiaquabacter sp. TaxID=3416354 RepID=UPI003D0E318F